MEKPNLVKNGGLLRLPPGFRFHPTDEELVVQYLRRKVLSYPLPAAIIPDVEVCKIDPWDLPGSKEKERYFFRTIAIKYPNGNRSNRATSSGYWKATGLDKQVASSKSGNLVGMKKTLVFYCGKSPKGCRTDWILHEYRLLDSQTSARENWVLCRIFLKRRNKKIDDLPSKSNRHNSEPIFIDFMSREKADLNLVLAPSSPASGITEISKGGEYDDQEESSCFTSISMASRMK